MPSAPAIRLELRRSRQHRLLVLAMVAVSLLSLLLAPWPLWLRVLAVMLLSVAIGLQLQSNQRVPRPAWLEWRSDGSWWLGNKGCDEPCEVQLRDARIVGPLIALRWCIDDTGSRLHSLLLWPDSAEGDALRRLRIRLGRHHERSVD